MLPVVFRRQLLAAFVLILLPALACAAPAALEIKSQDVSPAEKLKKQLDQPIALEVTDLSLNAALNQIREQTKINFVVDRFTIQQMGLDPEQMLVSARLKDVKARTCLRAVLAPYNLGYAIIGDTVLISTEDMAMHRQLKQRVNIDLEKVDLAAALKTLSRDTATNLLLDSRVPAQEAKTVVSVQMDDVPLDAAVRLLAETAGLRTVKVGNVFLVTTKARANELRQDPDLNPNNGAPQPIQGRADVWQMQQIQGGLINNPAFNGLIQIQGAIGPNGLPIAPQGNVPVPPLEKPAEKSEPPAEDEKPVLPKPVSK